MATRRLNSGIRGAGMSGNSFLFHMFLVAEVSFTDDEILCNRRRGVSAYTQLRTPHRAKTALVNFSRTFVLPKGQELLEMSRVSLHVSLQTVPSFARTCPCCIRHCLHLHVRQAHHLQPGRPQ